MKSNVVDARKMQEAYTIIRSTTEEEDVCMLAKMCYRCKPYVSKRLSFLPILRHVRLHYSYYIPSGTYNSDINIAKMLFAKHGIYMEEHESDILCENEKRRVLRCRHITKPTTDKTIDFMNRIKSVQTYNINAKAEYSGAQKLEALLKEMRTIIVR